MPQPTEQLNIDSKVWDDIITFIDSGRVIPIVGQGVVTFGEDDELLMPWLAKELAAELSVNTHGEDLALNEVVGRYLLDRGQRHLVYSRLHQILVRENLEPGPTLKRLASVEPFKLFVSTTFDSLLEKAIGGHKSNAKIDVCSYSPRDAKKDTPARIENLVNTTVYHIMGKSSPSDNFVVWEDDMMEFILGLHTDLNRSVVKNLSQDLADSRFHYLVFGLNFSDWLARFFLRATRQGALVDLRRMDYLADKIDGDSGSDLVMYFGSLGNNLHVLQCKPLEFVEELSRRWDLFKPKSAIEETKVAGASIREAPVNQSNLKSESIFISYAREDQQAAFRIRDGLNAYGLNVWIDQTGLKTGNNYRHKLEDVIQDECSFFISVISSNTESQSEAYFHRERTWAVEKAGFYDEITRAEYYHPVIIDETPRGNIQREPRAFRRSQRVRLIDGEVTKEFAERICELVTKKANEGSGE